MRSTSTSASPALPSTSQNRSTSVCSVARGVKRNSTAKSLVATSWVNGLNDRYMRPWSKADALAHERGGGPPVLRLAVVAFADRALQQEPQVRGLRGHRRRCRWGVRARPRAAPTPRASAGTDPPRRSDPSSVRRRSRSAPAADASRRTPDATACSGSTRRNSRPRASNWRRWGRSGHVRSGHRRSRENRGSGARSPKVASKSTGSSSDRLTKMKPWNTRTWQRCNPLSSFAKSTGMRRAASSAPSSP